MVTVVWICLTAVLLPLDRRFTSGEHVDGTSSAAKQLFRHPNQERFAEQLSDYDIVVPERVGETGNFASYRLSHRHRRSATQPPTPVHYRIPLRGNEAIYVRLFPNTKLLGPGVTVERWHRATTAMGDNTPSSMAPGLINALPDDHCHFHGEVTNQTKSRVAFSACDGLMGYIHFGEEHYFIEPLKRQGIHEGKHPHLIYKKSALPGRLKMKFSLSENGKGLLHESTMCGNSGHRSESPEMHSPDRNGIAAESAGFRRKKRSVSSQRNVETLVVADQMMVDYYSDEDIETYILTVLNMVSQLYRDSTIGNSINIVLVRLILLEPEEDHENDHLNVTHHADYSLKSFCKWQNQINPKEDDHPNHHDVAILITRYNICTRMNEPCSTLGLAEVAGMCQPLRSCNINEDTGLALAYTVAHEIGHNFGMNHDGPHNGCEPPFGERQHVMSPHLNSDTAPFAWSSCSREEITKFLDRDWGVCLDDEPSEHEFKFPEVPPGVMYDADHQCRLQYGAYASHCQEMDHDICTSLWCRQDNKCVTRLEPAAPGTRCGANKWCFNGQCTLMGDRPDAIDGEWGEWSEWTACSKSCGAGISHAERQCDNPPPNNGGKYCIGERKRYRICNTDACPSDTPSFRAVQCSSFNATPYKGELHNWIPVSIRATPCQLHCKPDGEFFSVMLADTVIDGTPCNPGTRDMCINGKCRKVACDWNIDSEAQEDRCGICHGDGTQCTTVRGEFTQKDGIGYMEVVVVPAGSRNIRIEEMEEASNYIAIKDRNGTYYLNGNWLIQWSGDYDFPGTIMYYRRDGELESLHAPGQLKEDMHIMFLFQSSNPGLKYEYTVPNANITRKPEFHWEYTGWSACTVTCGGGIQRSSAKCMEREAGLVEDVHCNATAEKLPEVTRSCNRHQCPSRWWHGPWQHCSVSCGTHGQRKRTVICIRSLGKDEQIALHDDDCKGQDKPSEVEPCPNVKPCPGDVFWKTGPWSSTCQGDPCNFQTRKVQCSVEGGPCDAGSKPVDQKQCGDIVCGSWVAGNWSECSRPCGDGVQFRRVSCEGGLKCVDATEPPSIRKCHRICDSPFVPVEVKPMENGSSSDTIPITIHTGHPTKAINWTSEREATMSNGGPVDEENELFSGVPREEHWDNGSMNGAQYSVETPRSSDVSKVSTTVASDVEWQLSERDIYVVGQGEAFTGDKPRHEDRIKLPMRPKPKSKGPKRPTGIVVDKVDPAHVKAVEVQFDLKEKYFLKDTFDNDVVDNNSNNNGDQGNGIVDGDAKNMDRSWMMEGSGVASEEIISEKNQSTSSGKQRGVAAEEFDPEFEWVALHWSKCSRPCSVGNRHREVLCYEVTTETLVDSGLCDQDKQPVAKEACNEKPCLEWQLTEWSECTRSCGDGFKARKVWCPEEDMCNPDTKPEDVMTCHLRPCVKWVAGPWSQCTVTCGSGTQVRHVKCINPDSQELAFGCELVDKPVHRKSCNTEECPLQNLAKFSVCVDKLESSLCASLRHMCNTWYFKVKCCQTCTKQQKKTRSVESKTGVTDNRKEDVKLRRRKHLKGHFPIK